ncbi:hypothetical protein BOTU111922_18615 [Bordetella tumulicola]
MIKAPQPVTKLANCGALSLLWKASFSSKFLIKLVK